MDMEEMERLVKSNLEAVRAKTEQVNE
jgi:hypothetical protein